MARPGKRQRGRGARAPAPRAAGTRGAAKATHPSFLTRAPLALETLQAEVAAPERGGICLFLGTVRDGPDEQGVRAIEYSAYEEMVEAEFARLVTEARTRWPEARIAVRHRLGRIPVGEASIAIIAAAPHRAQAFEACRFVIEEVKRRIPVWKKELRADGSEVWVDPSGHPTTAPRRPIHV